MVEKQNISDAKILLETPNKKLDMTVKDGDFTFTIKTDGLEFSGKGKMADIKSTSFGQFFGAIMMEMMNGLIGK